MTYRSMEVDVMGLRRLAEKATPGPWALIHNKYIEASSPRGYTFEIARVNLWKDEPEESDANAAYIAACSPAQVLSLLDRIEALEKGLHKCLPVTEHCYHTNPDPDGSMWDAVVTARSLLKEPA
jgi:hypothetical protein